MFFRVVPAEAPGELIHPGEIPRQGLDQYLVAGRNVDGKFKGLLCTNKDTVCGILELVYQLFPFTECYVAVYNE